ncbi:MAG: ABC transporter ATP-binding protein, partial [Lachnospiraceae bacterium]|nr:ABC transporter ATP-binding protein [Lachnospiraceae bacterium]
KDVTALKVIQLTAGRVTAFMNPATFLIVNVSTLAVLYFGAGEVYTGAIERGALVALLNYMAQILVELIKLANLIITMTKSVACADRISEMLFENDEYATACDSDEENNNLAKEKTDRIENIAFNKVDFAYPGSSKESLKDISFEAKKGEIIGIIGGTGSGKTTLINLICGYYSATNGEIDVNGKNIVDSSTQQDDKNVAMRMTKFMRDYIGIVPQTALLFSGTIEDNLKWGKKDASNDEMDTALKRACAYDFVYQKEGALKAEVTEGGKNFSGGQRQRLCIARAFVKEPEILILDDSTSALDYVTEKKVRAGIRELAKDSICFIVSQRAASIMDADKILVLDDGELAGLGKHEELIKTSEAYREIYKSQFPEEAI